jgi:hypothetical protein
MKKCEYFGARPCCTSTLAWSGLVLVSFGNLGPRACPRARLSKDVLIMQVFPKGYWRRKKKEATGATRVREVTANARTAYDGTAVRRLQRLLGLVV